MLLHSLGASVPQLPEPPTPAGLTDVVWSASPNLFTGWATLDGKSHGQPVRQAAAWNDLVTAFVAGLVGHVVVKWAALPAFQSLRLRAQAAV